MMTGSSRVVAVLGPTNTGKTTYAIERMLGHRTGVIGLPLRLLAREIYDRIVETRGSREVALVTGMARFRPPSSSVSLAARTMSGRRPFTATSKVAACSTWRSPCSLTHR